MFQKLTILGFLRVALLHLTLPSKSYATTGTTSAPANFTCTATTLPVSVTTNSTIFNLPYGDSLKNNSEVAAFTSTIFSANAQAFEEEISGGERELSATYDINTQLCVPKGGLAKNGTLIFAIHGWVTIPHILLHMMLMGF
jgi:hypothetical protein